MLLAVALASCSDGRGPGARAGTGGSGADAGAGSGGTVPSLDPGTKAIHRLNSTEYNATVTDVLGTSLQPANGSWRGEEFAGFDNIASVLGVDEAQVQRYFDAAQGLATEVMASDKLRARFMACNLTDPVCVTSSIERAGLRLVRRPFEPAELKTYGRVYESARELGEDKLAAFTLVLETLLSSAEFLYRIELDPDPVSTAGRPLGPFELASRLSYFLWSSAPDDALLDDASDGSLLNPEVLSAAVNRMFADNANSRRLVVNLAGQWLGAREVLSHPVDPELCQWSRATAQAASQESSCIFSDFLRSGRSWFDFPSANRHQLRGRGARVLLRDSHRPGRREVRAGRVLRRQACRLLKKPARLSPGVLDPLELPDARVDGNPVKVRERPVHEVDVRLGNRTTNARSAGSRRIEQRSPGWRPVPLPATTGKTSDQRDATRLRAPRATGRQG